jgi:hypothetical protein
MYRERQVRYGGAVIAVAGVVVAVAASAFIGFIIFACGALIVGWSRTLV